MVGAAMAFRDDLRALSEMAMYRRAALLPK
jgi:hypothetical protein